jgi:heme oxygenase
MQKSVCLQLKTQTAAYHKFLEDRLDLLSPAVTIDYYQWYLQCFYGFYLPVEKQINAVPLTDIHTGKSQWLAADLLVYGICPQAVPICQAIPSIGNLAQALGVSYVLEGATLGSQIILKHLKESLPFALNHGFNYLTAYKENTGKNWQSFKQRLEAYYLQYPESETIIISSATETFKNLAAWLDKNAPAEYAKLHDND